MFTWGPIKFYPSGAPPPPQFGVPDSHGPLEQSQPPSPRPRPRPTLSASPAHPHPRPSWGWVAGRRSLDISLPEVAVVCQFTGLTGGTLRDVVRHAKGHSLHLRAQGTRGLRALRTPGADLVRQAGHLGTQLGSGSPERPRQPPVAKSAGWLSAAGGGSSLHLRHAWGARG